MSADSRRSEGTRWASLLWISAELRQPYSSSRVRRCVVLPAAAGLIWQNFGNAHRTDSVASALYRTRIALAILPTGVWLILSSGRQFWSSEKLALGIHRAMLFPCGFRWRPRGSPSSYREN